MATERTIVSTDTDNLNLFFELSQDLLCIAGYDGYFKKINPAVSKLLGYSTAELMSRPINDFVYEGDKHATAQHRQYLTRAIPLLNFENRYVKKNGELIWLSWTSMPVEATQTVFAIAKNITHKKKLDEDRNALIANLTNINKDLKELTYTTSHDLRSPVNNLLTIFKMLDVTKIQDPETLEFIEILKGAADSLKSTLNVYIDALDQKEALKVYTEELDLQGSLDTVIHSLNALVKSSKTTIHVDFNVAGKVNFNKAYLESIFLNLVTNSIKYARPGHSPVIYISTAIINGKTQLIFADEGSGFDMDRVKDKVFGLNEKFHDHGDSKGIGLYLVHNHITNLGGHIALESQLNGGAKFTITFRD
jgi:PAS domain S-box-containing protein